LDKLNSDTVCCAGRAIKHDVNLQIKAIAAVKKQPLLWSSFRFTGGTVNERI
jgi:hypothetical protein